MWTFFVWWLFGAGSDQYPCHLSCWINLIYHLNDLPAQFGRVTSNVNHSSFQKSCMIPMPFQTWLLDLKFENDRGTCLVRGHPRTHSGVMDCFGTYFAHVQKASKSIVMNLSTCTHGAHKIHSGKTAKDLYLTTCAHGAHKIHSCKNKGVHTAKPFRVYRRGPWPRVQMRPLTACTDEAVTLATLARTIRVYLRPWPRTIRVYLRPQKARAQPTPWPTCFGHRTAMNCSLFDQDLANMPNNYIKIPQSSPITCHRKFQPDECIWKSTLHCIAFRHFPDVSFITAVSWSFLSVFLHCPSPLMIPSSPDTKPWPLHLRWCCRSNAGPSEWSSVEGPGPRPGTRQTIWEPRMKHTVPEAHSAAKLRKSPCSSSHFWIQVSCRKTNKSGLTIYTTLTRNFLWQSLHVIFDDIEHVRSY